MTPRITRRASDTSSACAADPARADAIVRGALSRLAERPDLDAFLDHILAAGAEQLGATSNALFTFDAASRTFQLRAFVFGAGALDATAPARRTAPATRTAWNAWGDTSDAGGGAVWPGALADVDADPMTWPRSAQFHRAPGGGSVLSVPLLVGGRPLGFTVARFADQTAPSPEQIGVAAALATQAALALELLRLADDATAAAVDRARAEAAAERTAELERTSSALQATADALASATTLDEVVPTVLRIVSRTFDSCVVAFFEVGAAGRLYLRHGLVDDRVLTASEVHGADVGPDAGPDDTRERVADAGPVSDACGGGAGARGRTRATVVDHRAGDHRAGDHRAGDHRAGDYRAGDYRAGGQRAGTGDPMFDSYARAHGCELELNVPLFGGGDPAGVLAVYRRADAPYTDAEVALAEALAKLLAVAVDGARLAAVARDRAVEGAVAGERERGAVEHAAVLARANEALRRGTARIAAQQGGTALRTAATLSEAFMLEALAATGAAAGALMQRVGEVGTEFTHRALTEAGPPVPPRNTPAADAAFRAASVADRAGFMRRVVDGEAVVYPVAELAAWHSDAYAYHTTQGNVTIGHFPIRVAGVVTGFLGLAWRPDAVLDATVLDTARALALQASLAFETQRLADTVRVAAVAVERQVAATALADERTRLAREMHDTLAQGLAGVVMQLAAARAKLGPAYSRAGPQLDLIDRLARETLAVARRAITMLRPHAPEAAGLDVGLQRLIDEPDASFSARPTLVVTGALRRAPADVEFELLRIAKAALANAGQHAGAAHIAITLDYGGEYGDEYGDVPSLRLVVADDGAGFDPAVARPGRFGLVGMRERAARVGAALTLVTAPGEGTEVVVVWPDTGGPG